MNDNFKLDKIAKHYWDFKFNNCIFTSKELNDSYKVDGVWTGIFKNDGNSKGVLLVGSPEYDDREWVYDGPYFNNGWNLLGITRDEFDLSMKRYLEETFNVTINSLW